MKVMIVKELMTGDVSPVAMFFEMKLWHFDIYNEYRKVRFVLLIFKIIGKWIPLLTCICLSTCIIVSISSIMLLLLLLQRLLLLPGLSRWH